MARKVRTKKEKKKIFIEVLVALIVLLIVGGIGTFVITKFFHEEPKETVKVNILQQDTNYGYTLTDQDSEYYKTEFNKLIEIIKKEPVNEEEYATQVARMFTIDLYTLSTKINKYDIGGYEFYYSDKREVLENKVVYEFYSTLLDNTYGDRNQELPEVSNVETVSTEKTTYKLGDNEVEGYLVKLKIEKKKDLGYDKEASIVVCKEQNNTNWSVVDFQPTLNPKY